MSFTYNSLLLKTRVNTSRLCRPKYQKPIAAVSLVHQLWLTAVTVKHPNTPSFNSVWAVRVNMLCNKDFTDPDSFKTQRRNKQQIHCRRFLSGVSVQPAALICAASFNFCGFCANKRLYHSWEGTEIIKKKLYKATFPKMFDSNHSKRENLGQSLKQLEARKTAYLFIIHLELMQTTFWF